MLLMFILKQQIKGLYQFLIQIILVIQHLAYT